MPDGRSGRGSSEAADEAEAFEAEAIEASSAEIAAAIQAGRRSRRSSREDVDWVQFDGYHEPSDATRSSMLAQTRLQGSLGLLQEPEPADLSSVIVCARYIQALYRRMQWRRHLRATRLEAHLEYKVNNKERFLQLQAARRKKFKQHISSIRLQAYARGASMRKAMRRAAEEAAARLEAEAATAAAAAAAEAASAAEGEAMAGSAAAR